MSPKINLKEAAETLSVANTLPFLLRKLRADSSIPAIRGTFTPEKMLSELEEMRDSIPETYEEKAKPYVFLISLFLSEDVDRFEKAARLQMPQFEWYADLAAALLSSSTSTTSVTFSVSPQITSAPNPLIGAQSYSTFEMSPTVRKQEQQSQASTSLLILPGGK